MNIKVVLLLFAVFATRQALHIKQSNLKGDPITDALADILEYVGRAVNALNLKLKGIDFSEAGFVKYVQAAALSFNKELLNFLDKLRKDTTDTGKVIIDCFKAQSDTVETDLNETVKEIGQCAEIGISGVKWYMDEYIEGMDWIYDNLNTYAKDLRSCDDERALFCIPEVLEKNNITLPILIGYAGGRIMEIAIGLVGGIAVAIEIKNCREQVLEKHLEIYSTQVFNAAISCIEKNVTLLNTFNL